MGDFRIAAGPYPEDQFLDDPGTDDIAQGSGNNYSQCPPQPLLTIIEQYEDKQENVQRHPETGFPAVQKIPVEYRVAPVIIDLMDQPSVDHIITIPPDKTAKNC